MDYISVPEALGVSALGLCVVFVVLILLMFAIYVMNLVQRRMQATAVPAAAAPEAPAAPEPAAPGSCGRVSTYDVPDRTAALLMAIVADRMKVPLNELRFISIKEIREEKK